MKKRDKLILAGDLVVGAALLIIGIAIQKDYYSSLLIGMGSGLSFGPIVQFIRHYYNTRPENIESYREKTRQREINLKDERKIQLRNRAGYITWAATMIICFIASFIAAVFRAAPLVVCVLAGIAAAQYIAATLIYKYLCCRM